MAADPDKMTDPAAVRRLLANAQRLENAAVVTACQRRLYELGGQNIEDPVERRLWQAVTAYEETLRQKHGRTQQASYTRRKIATKGAIATLSDWAKDSKLTPGFEALVRAGMARFTGEYVVVEFRNRFPAEIVEAAERKLRALDVALPE